MFKEKLHKLLCAICAFSVLMCQNLPTVKADEIAGKTAGVYAYVLNEFMGRYGSISNEHHAASFQNPDGIALNGVYYSDVVDFDNNGNSYLVIFTMDATLKNAEAHIWTYDEVLDEAKEVARLSKSYGDLPEGTYGEFYIGYNDEKRYISYKERVGNELITNEYYTVIEGDAFMYVNSPKNVDDAGIMAFNSKQFYSGIDVSDYNRQLDDFFNDLKNTSADSVTMEDMAEGLRLEDEEKIENVLAKAVNYRDFDISRFSSMDEYKAALNKTENKDKFYLITNMYNLGDEIYYVRFSTDRSFYNYTLLRRSDNADGGYQILKVRTDCIPLSDRELLQIKEEYSRNPLLLKKASGKLKADRNKESIIEKLNLPHIEIEKQIDNKWKLPTALFGGGIGLGLIIVLWFILLKDD